MSIGFISKITIQLKFVNSNLFVYNMIIQSCENLVFKFQEFNTSRHILFDTVSQAEDLNVFVSIDLAENHLHLLLRIPNHIFESAWAFVHIYWIKKLKIIIIYAKLHILCPFDLNTSYASWYLSFFWFQKLFHGVMNQFKLTRKIVPGFDCIEPSVLKFKPLKLSTVFVLFVI